MATAQTLLNNVLRSLRRDVITATSTTNSYHLLLIQYLNRSKDYYEEMHQWEALRSTVTVTGTASTQTYTLSAAGDADIDVNDNAYLLYEKAAIRGSSNLLEEAGVMVAGQLPQVFDTTDSTERRLKQISWEQFERLRLTDDGESETYAEYFALRVTGGYHQMGIWPMTDGARTYSMRFYIPQAVIPNTGMTSYTLTIPHRMVWLRAAAIAAKERGEETTEPVQDLLQEAEDAFHLARSRELTENDLTSYPV